MSSSSLETDSSGKALAQIADSEVIRTLSAALGDDAALHLVGGAVRDCLQGIDPTDIDLATVLDMERAAARLAAAGLRVIETGIEHGTVTVLMREQAVELTRFRLPTARHESRFSDSIEADLSGRDFTINAVAYSLAERRLVDPFGGREDIARAVVRSVGDPAARFREDPHRLMRLVRFGPAMGRTLDPATRDAAISLAPLLADVAPERLREELVKILLSSHPGSGIRGLYEIGLLPTVLPELLPAVGCAQNEFHIHDVFEHTLWVLDRAAPELTVRLAALFHDIGKPSALTVGEDGRRHFYKHEQLSEKIAKEAMLRLRFGHDEIKRVGLIVALHMRPLECGPTGMRRLLRELDDQFEAWRQLKCADAPPVMPADEFSARLAQFDALAAEEFARTSGSVREPLAVDGNDLLALGMKPGPAVGAILRALDELRIEQPDLNHRDIMLERARKLVLKSQN